MRNYNDEMALTLMDTYYDRMNACASSSGRNYNFKKMVALWQECPAVRAAWDFMENVRLICNRFVKRVKETIKTIVTHVRGEERPIVYNGCVPLADGIQQVYFIRLLDHDGNLVWSKVGTTAKETTERMRGHLNYYNKKARTIGKIIVDGVFDCGSQQAEAYESYFRSKFMFQYPGTFRKNDRFEGIEFNMNEVRAEVAALQAR